MFEVFILFFCFLFFFIFMFIHILHHHHLNFLFQFFLIIIYLPKNLNQVKVLNQYSVHFHKVILIFFLINVIPLIHCQVPIYPFKLKIINQINLKYQYRFKYEINLNPNFIISCNVLQ